MMVESSSEYICNREAGTGDTFFIFLLFAVFVHLMHTFMLLVYIFKERVTSDCSFTHVLHSCFAFICCFQGIGKEIIQYHLANVAQVQFHSFLLHISFLVRSSRFAELPLVAAHIDALHASSREVTLELHTFWLCWQLFT